MENAKEIDINKKSGQGLAPLECAMLRYGLEGDVTKEFLTCLLQKGADINQVGVNKLSVSYPYSNKRFYSGIPEDATLLAVAIAGHCFDMVEFLLHHGADIHRMDKDGNNLALAALEERMQSIARYSHSKRYIADTYKIARKLNEAGIKQKVPLLWLAISTKNTRVISDLFAQTGVGFDYKDKDGNIISIMPDVDFRECRLIKQLPNGGIEQIGDTVSIFKDNKFDAEVRFFLIIIRAEYKLKDKYYSQANDLFCKAYNTANEPFSSVFLDYIRNIVTGEANRGFSIENKVMLLNLPWVRAAITGNLFSNKSKYDIGMFCKECCEGISKGEIQFSHAAEFIPLLTQLSSELLAAARDDDQSANNNCKCSCNSLAVNDSSSSSNALESKQNSSDYCDGPMVTASSSSSSCRVIPDMISADAGCKPGDCKPSAPAEDKKINGEAVVPKSINVQNLPNYYLHNLIQTEPKNIEKIKWFLDRVKNSVNQLAFVPEWNRDCRYTPLEVAMEKYFNASAEHKDDYFTICKVLLQYGAEINANSYNLAIQKDPSLRFLKFC